MKLGWLHVWWAAADMGGHNAGQVACPAGNTRGQATAHECIAFLLPSSEQPAASARQQQGHKKGAC